MASKDEQETTISVGRNDSIVSIWTNNPIHARKLEKDARVTKVSSNVMADGADEFGGFYEVAVEDFNVVGGFKRRVKMSEERRIAAREQLARMRQERSASQ